MTNTEVYNAARTYCDLRAKSGCAKDKKHWIQELRLWCRLIDHYTIMTRFKNEKYYNTEVEESLQEAYYNLKAALTKALTYVVEPK